MNFYIRKKATSPGGAAWMKPRSLAPRSVHDSKGTGLPVPGVVLLHAIDMTFSDWGAQLGLPGSLLSLIFFKGGKLLQVLQPNFKFVL